MPISMNWKPKRLAYSAFAKRLLLCAIFRIYVVWSTLYLLESRTVETVCVY